MRISLFLLFACFFQVFAANNYAQTKKLTLSMDKATIAEVLQAIEDQSEFKFFYNNQLIDVTSKVNVAVRKKKIWEVLDNVLPEAGITYRVVGKQIALFQQVPNSGKPAIRQQPVTVTGKVTDEDDNPLPGVNILIKGTVSGTITDVDGNYNIQVDDPNTTLVFSFIGYNSQEVAISGRVVINIILVEKAIGLEEVIAVGYGFQNKSDLISSVISVKPESAIKVPSTDLGEMLRGKAAGMFVTLANAAPGSSSNILIRGKNSIRGGNSPIIIADGVPIGDINEINPYDIASIDVLKDAAAQAIYGARASNGVILITTKRAETGKTKVNYFGYYGMQTVHQNFDVYSGEEFAQLRREAIRTDNNNNYLPDSEIFTPTELEVLSSGEFIDWKEEVLRIAPIQDHNISVSSGTEVTKVYSSLNYMNQQGVVPGTDYQRFNIRINMDQKITDWLTLGANTSWRISETNDPGTGETLKNIVTASPLGKIYNEDGSYKLHPSDVQESFNPLLDLETVTNLKHDQNYLMNIFLDFKPFEGFNYRFNASRISWNRHRTSYSTAESYEGVTSMGGRGLGSIQDQYSKEWQFENIFTYDLKQNKNNLGFTFVQSISEKKQSDFENMSTYFSNDILGIYGLNSADNNLPTISAYKRGLVSFVGRVQYNYDSKYYVYVSTRADASTVFGTNNKWGYFPAVAVGWSIYRESFIEDIPTISNLKLRVSYGSVGNEGIGPYQSLSMAEQRDYIKNPNIKQTGYIAPLNLPNPDLKWETSKTFNTALDFGFWKNRLSGTVEFYNTRTEDLLVDRALSAILGYTMIKTNIGEVENQGIELTMNGIIVDKKDLMINASFTFSKNNNKIISLYGELDNQGNEIDDVGNHWFIGQPIDVFYKFKPIGIFQEDDDIASTHQPNAKPGDIILYDRYPDDGEVNADDYVITKSDPDWYGSFNFEMKYKNFDFSADVITVQGITRYNSYMNAYWAGGSLRSILNGVKQDYWTPENPSGNWPRPTEANDPTYMYALGLQDASYLRLQTVMIGYTLPNSILSKIKLSRVRIYCTGHNLFTITDFQSYSPEKHASEYPEAISIVGGLQISF